MLLRSDPARDHDFVGPRSLVEAPGRNTSAALTVEVGAAQRREA